MRVPPPEQRTENRGRGKPQRGGQGGGGGEASERAPEVRRQGARTGTNRAMSCDPPPIDAPGQPSGVAETGKEHGARCARREAGCTGGPLPRVRRPALLVVAHGHVAYMLLLPARLSRTLCA
eukprot:5882027-Prymnesium_polylepis.1